METWREELHDDLYLEHHGILGQKWGVRRFQNEDGTLTEAGKKRYGKRVEETYGDKKDYKKASRAYKHGNAKQVWNEYANEASARTGNKTGKLDDETTYKSIELHNYETQQRQNGRSYEDIIQDSEYKKRLKDFKDAADAYDKSFRDDTETYRQVGIEYANRYRDALLRDIGIEPTAEARELIKKYAQKRYNWD